MGSRLTRTKICGGGAKSPLWRKIIANVMNLKVDMIESEEGPGMGGAMLAAVACGAFDSVEDAAAQDRTCGRDDRAGSGAGGQNMKTDIRNLHRFTRRLKDCLTQ